MAVFPSIKPIYGGQITVNQGARTVKLGGGLWTAFYKWFAC